jgi:hypothetical protein
MKRFAGEKFNFFNPLTYGNVGKAIEKTQSGDPNVEYSEDGVGAYGGAVNERNRILNQMRADGLL